MAIDALAKSMAFHREQIAVNHLENIRRYLKETGGDGAIAITKGALVAKVVGSAQKSFITTITKMKLDQALSAKLGSLATKALGVYVSMGLSVLYDLVSEWLFDPTGKALRAAFRAGNATGVDAMFMATVSTLVAQARQKGEHDLLTSELRRSARYATSDDAVAGVAGWADEQSQGLRASVADSALYDALIETWLLQRAGDEESGNKDTDPEAYDAVHKKFATDGNLARRDLFIHQCRFELGRLGVDAEPTLNAWSKRLATQPQDLPLDVVIARLGPLVFETDQFERPDRLAHYVGERFAWDEDLDLMPSAEQLVEHQRNRGGSGISISVGGAPSGFAQGAQRGERKRQHQEREGLLTRAADNTQRFQLTAKTGGVRLECAVDLTEDDGAIYVEEYRYHLKGTRHNAEGQPREQSSVGRQDARVPTRSWSDSPK